MVSSVLPALSHHHLKGVLTTVVVGLHLVAVVPLLLAGRWEQLVRPSLLTRTLRLQLLTRSLSIFFNIWVTTNNKARWILMTMMNILPLPKRLPLQLYYASSVLLIFVSILDLIFYQICLAKPCYSSEYVTCGLGCAETLCKRGSNPYNCNVSGCSFSLKEHSLTVV